jgi:DNA modification methylase
MLDNELRPPISLVEIDPPYAIDLVGQKKGDAAGLEEYNEIDSSQYRAQMRQILELCMKVTPPNCRFIVWFGVEWYQTFIDIFNDVGLKYDLIPGIWAKPNGQTNAPDLYLARNYETFFVAWKGDIPIPRRGRSNVFAFKPDPHTAKYHPTQRPQELMEEILLTFAYPGSVVLVPYLGSGSTLRAAYRCGMNAFGWDLSEHYKEQFLAAVETDIQSGRYNTILTMDGEQE